MLKQSSFNDRDNLPKFLNERGLVGEAVEVGTHRADFAAVILKRWKGKCLYCVDPWCSLPGYETQEARLWGGTNREGDYQHAKNILSQYGNRAQFIRETSVEAVTHFTDNTLDFVYIDGDHRYEMVKQDLEIWWPKIKVGGVLAGHDFICTMEEKIDDYTVQPAVLEFVTAHNLIVRIIVEMKTSPWSFYIIKGNQ